LKGLLSTVAVKPDENTSQFLVTLAAAPSLDGKHHVFGKVISGFELLEKLSGIEVDTTEGINPTCRPIKRVIVHTCGVVEPKVGLDNEEPELDEMSNLESLEYLEQKVKHHFLSVKPSNYQIALSSVSHGFICCRLKNKRLSRKRYERVFRVLS